MPILNLIKPKKAEVRIRNLEIKKEITIRDLVLETTRTRRDQTGINEMMKQKLDIIPFFNFNYVS